MNLLAPGRRGSKADHNEGDVRKADRPGQQCCLSNVSDNLRMRKGR